MIPFNVSRYLTVLLAGLMASALALGVALPRPVSAASTDGEINAKVRAALARLSSQVIGSESITGKAKGVLVFPEVIKAGFVIAGEGGEGALLVGGKTLGY